MTLEALLSFLRFLLAGLLLFFTLPLFPLKDDFRFNRIFSFFVSGFVKIVIPADDPDISPSFGDGVGGGYPRVSSSIKPIISRLSLRYSIIMHTARATDSAPQ